MKKTIASITVLCYLLLSTGVVVNYHYCMKRLASVKFYSSETEVCSRCGMEMHELFGCCHDEVEVYKLDADQNKSDVFVFTAGLPVLEASTPSKFLATPYINVEVSHHFHNHSPPLLSEQDTYLQNGVFRI